MGTPALPSGLGAAFPIALPRFRERGLLVALSLCLLFVVLAWRLGGASFWDPDEAHYAETTREMLASGDWLAPMYNGQPFFDKPIIFHWLQGASMTLFGSSETGARAVTAFSALVLVLATAWFGTQVASLSVGWIAAMLLACNPGLFALARYAILDTPFTACLFGGAAVLTVAALKERRRLEYVGYLLIAGATAIKGPIAIVLCGVTFTIAILVSKEARRVLLALQWMRGLALVVVVSAPWFIYMLYQFGRAFVDGYVLDENVRLFLRPLYANQPGRLFYPRIVAYGMLPWTAVVAGRAYDQVRGVMSGRARLDVVDVLLWSWIVAIVGLFSLSRFRLDHYVFPATPALCLICARGWVEVRETPDQAGIRGTRLGILLIGPILVIAGAVLAVLALTGLALPMSFLVVPVALIGLGVLALVHDRPRRFGALPLSSIAAMLVLYVGVLGWVIPKIEQAKVIPELARWVQAEAQPSDRISTFQLNRWNPSFRFYVDRRVEMLENEQETVRFFEDASPFFCVMRAEHFDALVKAGVPLTAAYRREGVWATSGRTLRRGVGASTEFVIATRRQ